MIGTVETCIGEECAPSQLTTPGPLELQKTFHQMVEKKLDRAVMEVSSIALDQKRTAGTRFQAAIFTNFSQDHLDYHKSIENYFQSKLKLFTDYGLPLAVVNLDDEWSKRILIEGKAKRFLTYSLKDPSSDFFAGRVSRSLKGISTEIKTPVGSFPFSTQMFGEYNLYNLLAVLSVFYGLEGKCESALAILEKAVAAPGRMERVMEGDLYPNIFVDYAHSEDALRNVLESLKLFKSKHGKLITVFGCGGDRDKSKRPRMGKVVSQLSDLIVLTSDNPRTENPEHILDEIQTGINGEVQIYRETLRKSAIEWALSQATPNDIVLIAGKGHETYQVIGSEQFPFDDRQVVRDYYK
jgi:UDP-N-acetylmuramoyl-L-alanyl-D-glutamate--2,6-diaminopimelate ligase